MAYDSDDPAVGTPLGVVDPSRGVWAFTTDVDLLLRLARGGFDWVALDAQHGPVDRAVLHAVGRARAVRRARASRNRPAPAAGAGRHRR